MTFPWQQAWETGGLGRGVRRGREWEAECWGGSKQHWYIAMETLFHQQPTAIVSQHPRNGFGVRPGRGWGSRLASPEATSTSRTPVPLLSRFPNSLDTASALASIGQSQIQPRWRMGGNTNQQTKQPEQVESEAKRDNFSDSPWFSFHLSGSIWTTQIICFHTPDGCRKRMSLLITEIKIEMLLPCKLSYRGKKKGCCWVDICTRPGPLQVYLSHPV